MTLTPNIEAAARALAAYGLVEQDGLTVTEQVDARWADEEQQERLVGLATAALKGVHDAEYARARARMGVEVTVDKMLADDDVLAAVAGRHGMGLVTDDPADLNGNLQHLISPIVGMLRMESDNPHRTERLSLVLALLRRAYENASR